MALFILSLGGVASILIGVPIIGFVLSPLIKPPPDAWRDIGAVDSIKLGETKAVTYEYGTQEPSLWAGPTNNAVAWLRRTGPSSFIAYASYCTHLGCPVHWLPTPQIFLCPCHGSVFNANGTVAGGPAPRPLFTYPVRVRNGRVEIKAVRQPGVSFTT